MPTNTKLSVVLPVRDRQYEITDRVESVLDALTTMTQVFAEVVVVDDGSRDETPEILDELQSRYPQVRVARHSRPRGMEAAGQTGLERATGDLVFIQESNTAVRLEDLRRLLEMSNDDSIVAARAESTERSLSAPLMRRLKAWGTKAELQAKSATGAKSSLQMIRRPHLQRLCSPAGKDYQLHGETYHATTTS